MNITREMNQQEWYYNLMDAETCGTLEESAGYAEYLKLCETAGTDPMVYGDWLSYQKHVKSPGTTLTPETFQRFQENSREDLEAMVKSLEDENVELITELDRMTEWKLAAEEETNRIGKELLRLREELEVTTDWLDKNKVENASLKQELADVRTAYKFVDDKYDALTYASIRQKIIPSNQPLFPHYYKDVPRNATHVDIYWVLKAWEVTDPCIQHAVKKLMAAGRRGAKNTEKDLKEARDSITRALELENTK
jgi:hypothetical protein